MTGVAKSIGANSSSPMHASATLRVNETFVSIQGEGEFIGTPSLFIRLDGCPLRCAWCDTPYALAGDAGREMSVEEIAALAGGQARVVITGGEPLAQDIAPLVGALADRHITVETSGTIFADLPEVSLFSISPKLGSSGYTPKPVVLRKYFTSAAGRMQLKFVIADNRDLELSRALLNELDGELPRSTPIVLQPESGSAGNGDSYIRALERLTQSVLADPAWRAYDVRVLPQLNYLLWKGVAGK